MAQVRGKPCLAVVLEPLWTAPSTVEVWPQATQPTLSLCPPVFVLSCSYDCLPDEASLAVKIVGGDLIKSTAPPLLLDAARCLRGAVKIEPFPPGCKPSNRHGVASHPGLGGGSSWSPITISPTLEKTLRGSYKRVNDAPNQIPIINPIVFFQQKSFDLYALCRSLASSCDLFEALLENQDLLLELEHFSFLIEESVKNRVRQTTPYCINCLHDRRNCNHAKIAILFSGGIDCSILAALSNKYVKENDPIDLINVAFEKLDSTGRISWDVPDRLSAKSSLMELKNIYPRRRWNYVEVNVRREELHDNLRNHIKHLLYPLNTVLDESIGCAFWFASRGKGICSGKEYISTARVSCLNYYYY
ncbi:asparagine synthetase domain-containing protein CG17486-like [Rhagoletis pomonella]|uniref:asparagine synthetase domain-containing protein CG17486-like n=1 Tax=Rhagoletis pomonella TaxID=28610 RepID=UPI00178676FD|nr:asparagine synthetase domain-containing protein CG17486-like [Rhagoletis pomonella]